MSDPKLYGPTRSELWFWLAVACIGLGVMAMAVVLRPPSGPAVIEVMLLPGLLFGWLGLPSVRRLFRREHPFS